MKRTIARMGCFCLLLLVAGFCCSPRHAHAAGASPWDAMSVGVGLQGRWLDQGTEASNRDLEAAGNVALGLTNHVDVTFGGAYGFDGSYGRAQADARLTATDVNESSYNVWVGVGRYISKRPTDGLNEWAGKAGVGWHPLKKPDGKPRAFLLGATAAYGLDTERRTLTVFGGWLLKGPKEAKP